MDNNEVLDHFLEIESKAAVLVDDAQAEADRRVAEAEHVNRETYDKRCHAERERLEGEFQKSKERVRQQYQEAMEAYNQAISAIPVDAARFSALLDKLVMGET